MTPDVKDMIFLLLDKQGRTAKELGDYIGVKSSSISAWKNENSYPSSKLIVRISEFFGVSPTFLCTGSDPSSYQNLSKTEEALLKQFRSVSENEQQLLIGALAFILTYQNADHSESSNSVLYFSAHQSNVDETNSDEIAVYDLPASAGTGLYLDSDDYRMIKFKPNTIPRGTSFGVRISGFSMVPSIQDGEVVFVKRQPYLDDGDLGIFVLNGDAYCKRYRSIGGVRLESDNSMFFHPIEVKESDDLRILGKVIGHARPLHP